MIEPDFDALPVVVLRVDADDRVIDSNAWFRGWIGVEPTGRTLDELLVVVPDFLDETNTVLMASTADRERVLMLVRERRGDGALLTGIDASDRYASGKRLRRLHGLADRTQTRLQLIMDASIAFATATTEERLSQILAITAARAYQAEESAVALCGEDGVLHRTAGTNPFHDLIPESLVSVAPMRLREVVKISGLVEAEQFSPLVASAMRQAGVHAFLAAPLHLEEAVVGVFACFFRHPRAFDDEATPLAEALAGQATQKLAAVRLQRRLEHAATHDETTDLPNRRSLEDLADLTDLSHATVIFIDLDGFKAVNDQLGHEFGDEVLREVARRLQANLREGDVVARYGGDEFVVIITADAHAAVEVAERLRAAVEQDYTFLTESLPIRASIGIAHARGSADAGSVDQLIRLADQAMYLAKSRGGNQVASAG
ncbi:diguanylate cyclase (GGDEF)-like protein [Microbacterium trichothecenolyticum]|uniref:diguanylate cyclase n=1 Tax=Microbacterium trichothecenolyticum TaxID=69370 RepID=UPI002859ADB1|nr:diguanylate cyclase [Microbacterium trichothecenolyticum]MDR7113768.1 diguanylate cyclase (GGDEF)-like protein [Microbacterium trichothecenolyticum]